MRVMCVILTLLACGEDLSASADLTAAPAGDLTAVPDDLTVAAADFSAAPALPDLAFSPWMPFDPAAFCGGPDGGLSCAQAFFVKLAICYRPAGHCGSTGHNFGAKCCWQSGSIFDSHYDQFSQATFRSFDQDGFRCGRSAPQSISPPMTAPELWTLWDGSTLLVDPRTGDATCQDGTHANVGVDYAGCAAVDALLQCCTAADYSPAIACAL